MADPPPGADLGSGFGGNTRVVNVNGRQLLINENGETVKDLGPVSTSADNTPSVDGAGVQFTYVNGRPQRYVRHDDGTYGFIPYEPVPVATNPRPGVSVSQSFQDPAALQIQRDQQAAQATQAKATLDEQIRVNNATIANGQADLMIKMQNASFLDKKFTFETDQAKITNNLALARDARETQAQLFTQQQAVSSLQLQIAGAQFQRDSLQAQLTQRTNEFNQTQKFATDQANTQANEQRASRLQSLAGTAGTLAADPGDRAKFAGFLEANSRFGSGDAALAKGANFITNDSLTPLESTLRTARDVQAQPVNPYQFTATAAPTIAPLDLSKIGVPQITATAAPTGATTAGTIPPGYKSATPAEYDRMAAIAAQSQGTKAVATPPPNAVATPPPNADTGAAGGSHGYRIVGERGIELEAPDGTIMNQEQVKQMLGIDLKKLSAMPPGTAPDNYDTGIFGGGFGNVQDADRSLATSFLGDASSRAIAGTPWAGKALPTPVYASSPGFNPYVTQLLASLNAQARGLPAQYFQDQAALLAPAGLSQRVVGRSA